MPYSYGRIRDLDDHRDLSYLMPQELTGKPLPSSVDLRPHCPPIYDQGNLGSCTAFAITGALEYDQIKQGETLTQLSELFVYYNERAKEGTIPVDAGASIRDGIKSVKKQGACPELDWPYDITQFAVEPPEQCYQDAQKYEALSYARVPHLLRSMQGCLAAGFPFVAGISVYESFETDQVAQTGMVPMPQADETLLGGHAIVVVGYDAHKWIFRNSWSEQWGDSGYGYLPLNYLLNMGLASDFWTIRTVS